MPCRSRLLGPGLRRLHRAVPQGSPVAARTADRGLVPRPADGARPPAAFGGALASSVDLAQRAVAVPAHRRTARQRRARGVGASGGRWQGSNGEHRWRLVDDAGGTVEAFLRAATRLVNEQGYQGASIARIRRSSISPKARSITTTTTRTTSSRPASSEPFPSCAALDLSDGTGGPGWDRSVPRSAR